ncbi:RIP metalloprotease RseP [Biformimicrobium ophioploci]|nr:RIP metalloprotease RseP [Microbulbifer sp. NKW57]
MELLQTILWALVALGVLVTFHEFGHFWVARRCGVRVERFSVGFGKRLVSWYDKHGTEFTVAAIPLGGYVKMLDEREGPVDEDMLDQAFNRKSVWQRIAIAAAGPIANFILAIFLFWLVFLGGTAGPAPIVDKVTPGSLADMAGLEPRQEIVALDGHATPTWQALNWRLAKRLGDTGEMEFTVRYPDSHLEYEMVADINRWLSGKEVPDPLAEIGIELYRPPATMRLAVIAPDSPAEKAGLRAGDTVVSSDGQPFTTWEDWTAYIRERAGKAISVGVERDGETVTLEVTPIEHKLESGEVVGRIGVGPFGTPWPEEMIRRYEYGIGGALLKGLNETWEKTAFTLAGLKKLIFGEISPKNLSGPITIAKVAGTSAESGWQSFLGLLALLSISLGVLNLLPIPVLDGGHLLYYFVEAIRGKPVSERTQIIGLQIGMAMIIGIMMLALYNDITRL